MAIFGEWFPCDREGGSRQPGLPPGPPPAHLTPPLSEGNQLPTPCLSPRRHGVLLGSRAALLEDAGGLLLHPGGLRGRLHPPTPSTKKCAQVTRGFFPSVPRRAPPNVPRTRSGVMSPSSIAACPTAPALPWPGLPWDALWCPSDADPPCPPPRPPKPPSPDRRLPGLAGEHFVED